MKSIELKNKKFGNLKVIKRTNEKKHRSIVWLCKCICGQFKKFPSNKLISGHTKPDLYGIKGYIWKTHKRSCKERNIKNYLSKEQYLNLALSNCYYCGVSPNKNTKGLLRNGVDRKNNEPFYKIENSIPCCLTCNFAKKQLPFSEFLDYIKRLINYNISETEHGENV